MLQRNRNVQAVLESKQSVESQRIFLDIKKNLLNNVLLVSQTANSTYIPYGSKMNPSNNNNNHNHQNDAKNQPQKNRNQNSNSNTNDFDDRSFFPPNDYQNEEREFNNNINMNNSYTSNNDDMDENDNENENEDGPEDDDEDSPYTSKFQGMKI